MYKIKKILVANCGEIAAGNNYAIAFTPNVQFAVYTISVELFYRASKLAGEATFVIPNREGIVIVRGSSGWGKKI